MKTMTMTGYSYDALTNILTVTAAFLKKASQYGTAEYNVLKGLRADNPNMKIEKQTRKASSSDDESKRPITAKYADMEHFIKQFPVEQQEELMDRYKKVRAMSKTHRSPYKYVLDWFVDYFPLYGNDAEFDEEGKLTSLITKHELAQKKLQKELEDGIKAVQDAADKEAA
ncbi:MAG: hypothetical protein J6K32_10375 [Clostridia bacterium]|nr:hypothetical protein [Clostridia bacterium]